MQRWQKTENTTWSETIERDTQASQASGVKQGRKARPWPLPSLHSGMQQKSRSFEIFVLAAIGRKRANWSRRTLGWNNSTATMNGRGMGMGRTTFNVLTQATFHTTRHTCWSINQNRDRWKSYLIYNSYWALPLIGTVWTRPKTLHIDMNN